MENVKDEDVLIKNMAKLMIVKFDKYWDEYSVVFCIWCNFRLENEV